MSAGKRTPLLRRTGVQTLIASLLCILLGLAVGFVALCMVNAAGAGEAMMLVLKNFMKYTRTNQQLKYAGMTLVRTAPLVMCSLSVLFAYKVGLFNIGAAGQYVAGAGAALYFALVLKAPWPVCMLASVIAGALLGSVSGMLKAYRNVNEVISCIMLNWISLYLVNMLLMQVKEPTGKDTVTLAKANAAAILPSLGLDQVFGNNKYVTIAIPMALVFAVLVWVVLNKTKLGYELKATGLNKQAAKYCGMREQFNIILTMAIAGGLAGLGASMLYLTDYEQWAVTQSSVPGMGFNGIAAAFLGGLNPLGTVLSSFFIQHITDGGSFLTSLKVPVMENGVQVTRNVYCSQTSDFISSIIIYLCGFVLFIRLKMNSLLDERDERRNAHAKEVK
ncbi:MAG: ABC transporter permease [bacterium]|nr:ABC transporter permease [bacterium]